MRGPHFRSNLQVERLIPDRGASSVGLDRSIPGY